MKFQNLHLQQHQFLYHLKNQMIDFLNKIEKLEQEKKQERIIKVGARPRSKKKAYSMVDDDDW